MRDSTPTIVTSVTSLIGTNRLTLRRDALFARFICAVVFVLTCSGLARASADVSRPVRVKVVENQRRVSIVDAAGTTLEFVADSTGTLTANGEPVGSRWRSRDRSEFAGPFRLHTWPDGHELVLRGRLEVHRRSAGLLVINEVSLENYVVGALGGEMVASWEPAALRAQAVACRSYALYQMAKQRGKAFDLSADVLSQRYLGMRGESDAAWAAVRATTGVIIGYDGRPALAAFHSNSGGRTASASEVWGTSIPYLRSVPVANEDDSPGTYWRIEISGRTLSRALAQLGHELGAIQSAAVAKRSASDRVEELRFRGTRGRATVTGRELRQVLGGTTLKSTKFYMRWEKGGMIIAGSGNGHGVGMSQWGAQAMAQEGASYQEILGKFYPGTSLLKIEEHGRRFANFQRVDSEGRNVKGETMGDQLR